MTKYLSDEEVFGQPSGSQYLDEAEVFGTSEGTNEDEKKRRKGVTAADMARTFGAAVVNAGGGLLTAGGRAIEQGAQKLTGLTMDEAQRLAESEGQPEKALEYYERANRLNPVAAAGRLLQAGGDKTSALAEDIRNNRTEGAAELIRDAMPTGDITSPSSWKAPANPTVAGTVMAGLEAAGSIVPQIAAAAATRGASAQTQVKVGAAVGGAQIGGAAIQEADEYLGSFTDEQLTQQSPVFRDLVAKGYSPADARQIVVREAGNRAATYAAPAGMAGGAATGAILGKAGDAVAAGSSRAVRAAVLGTLGMIEEGSQEVVEGIATRAGINDAAGTTRSLTEGTVEEFAMGALGGGPTGAARGAMARQQPQAPAPAPVQPPAPPTATAPTPAPAPGLVANLANPVDSDPAARLAQLEMEAEGRDLTPAEQQEFATLAQQIAQDDQNDQADATIGQTPAAAPAEAAAPAGGDGAPAAGPAAAGPTGAGVEAAGVNPRIESAMAAAKKALEDGGTEADANRAATDALIASMDQDPSISIAQLAPQAVQAAQQALQSQPILPPLKDGPDVNLQNRDRGRAASVVQMTEIARNPDYMRLGPSRTPDSGAPMVFAVGDDLGAIPPENFGRDDVAVMSDGQRVPFRYAVVDATQVNPSNFADGRTNELFSSTAPGTIKALNNGRTAGIRASHEMGTAAGYIEAMQGDSAMHGISPDVIARTPNPILVRVYPDGMNTAGMAAKSQGQGLGMSPAELARQDAPLLDSSVLGVYQPGDITSADNRDFVRAFVGKLQGAGQDVASMMTGDGQLSQDGRKRIQAALMQAAYGDSDLVEEMFDSTDTDIKAIGDVLKDLAGEWANMRDSAKVGAIDPAADLTENLLQVLGLIRKARRDRQALADLVNQPDLMTGETPPDATVGMLRLFYDGEHFTRAVGKERLAAGLRRYVQGAMATSPDAGLFGDAVKPTDILSNITVEGDTNAQAQTGQQQQQPAGGGAGGRRADGGGQADRQQQPAQGRRGSAESGGEGSAGAAPAEGGQAGPADQADEGNDAGALTAAKPQKPKKPKAQKPTKGAPEPRAMTYEGRAVDGKPLMPGDTFRTASGRITTGFPKQSGQRYVSQWLINNAILEAEARGDGFNLTGFKSIKPLKGGELTPADGASLNEYLFGQQPAVVPSILKPLTGRADAAPAANPLDPAVLQRVGLAGVFDGISAKDLRNARLEWNGQERLQLPQAVAMLQTMAQDPDMRADADSLRQAIRDRAQQLAQPDIPALTQPTRQDIEAQQDRAGQADKLDDREQIRKESEAGAGLFQLEMQEGRQDNTGDLFGTSQQETDQAQASADDLRRQLRDLEDRIVGAAGLAPGFIEDAMRSRKVSKDLKDQRDALRQQLRDLQGQVDTARANPAPEAAPADPDAEAMAKAADDLKNALGDLGEIFGKNFRANMLPEQEQKLIPVLTRVMDAAFRLGYLKFKDAAKYALDQIRAALGNDVADAITVDHLQGAYIGMAGRYKDKGAEPARTVVAVDDKADIENHTPVRASAAKETNNAAGPDGSVERNRRQPAPERTLGDPVPADAAGAAGGARPAGGQAGGAGRGGQSDGARVSAGGTAAGGNRGDFGVPGGNAAVDAANVATGADFRERGSDIGLDGVSADPVPAAQVDAAAQGGNDRLTKEQRQRAAESIPVKPGDLDNIKATLPYLLPGQQEDVLKAEQRFAQPDGYGMLFTNGTGTGKTFSGLGIVKRFERQGKTNTLIVVPDDKIASDWIESARALGLKATQLADTKSAGTGIVVATYANLGSNDALATRDWDLVVADEAHTLMQSADGKETTYLQNLRAISYHPRGREQRFTMLNRPDIDELRGIKEQIEANTKILNNQDTMDAMMSAVREENARLEKRAEKLREKLTAARDKNIREVQAKQGAPRTRLAALSATPFAYEFTIDWADGYLFDYNEGQPREDGEMRPYNSGTNRERFFMLHFGYSMRYNKLTKPDPSKVDTGLLQRNFNGFLKKRGSLSGRMLDVAADYDRRFVLVDSAIGNRIDEAISWIGEQARNAPKSDRGYGMLRDVLNEKFDYLSRRYLLEAIKATESVDYVRKQLALGRKVVVFHDYKKGGGFNPFDIDPGSSPLPSPEQSGIDAETIAQAQNFRNAVAEFRREFKDLVEAPLGTMDSPIEVYKREFPDVLLINGDEKPGDLLQRYKTFQDDASGPVVALVQSAKNKGWSGHDTTGKHQRVLVNLGQPTAPTLAIQQEGRIYRTGQVTNAIMRYFNTGTNWEKWAFASTIAGRASTAENLGMGELARALKDSFIAAFEESDAYPPGHEGEGTGGKERDKAQNAVMSLYDRAKTYYWATQKKNAKTKAQEGKDYFATPEPVGLKMVEWLDIKGGEDTLEPSAGHGAIARWLPETTTRTVIEPSTALRSRLAMAMNPGTDRIIDGTFEDHAVVNKYHGIAMNPPFGVGGSDAIPHLAKAATHLRDGGRIVALIPVGPAADKRFDAWFYGEETRKAKPMGKTERAGEYFAGDIVELDGRPGQYRIEGRSQGNEGMLLFRRVDGNGGIPEGFRSHQISKMVKPGERTEKFKPAGDLHLVAEIKLPSVTFERAGTGVMTRIVVIEKQADPKRAPQQRSPIDLTDIESTAELFDRLEDLSLPARTPTAAAEAAAAAERAEQEEAARKEARKAARQNRGQAAQAEPAGTLDRNGAEVIEHITQKGKTIRGIVRTDLLKDEAQKLDPYTFRKDGGWFIREKYLKPEGGDGPVFSRGQARTFSPAAQAQAVEAVESQVAGLVAGMAKGPNVVVAFDMQDPRIPEEVRAEDRRQRAGGASGTPEGFYYRGTAYIMASQMKTPADTVRVFAHEVLGHHGLRSLFGKELRPILQQIVEARADQVAAKMKEYGLRGVSNLDKLTAAEEILAEMAQTQPQLGFVRRAVAAIRTWLRENVPALRDLELTDAEIIRSYILPVRDFVQRGQTASRAAGVRSARRALAARSDEEGAAPFYSALAREVAGVKTERAPAQGWIEQLRGLVAAGKVKADELEWTGLTDWLQLQQGKVGRDQILAYLEENGVQVQDVVLGDLPEEPDDYDRPDVTVLDTRYLDEDSEDFDPETAEREVDIEVDGQANYSITGSDWAGMWSVVREDGQVVGDEFADLDAAMDAAADDYLEGMREQFKQEMAESGVDGPSKYGRYTLPGGENYREVLLTLPEKATTANARYIDIKKDGDIYRVSDESGLLKSFPTADEAMRYRAELHREDQNRAANTGQTYQSSHWDQKNIVAHIRLNDRTDADGKRVLFVEELQSDWAQEGRKKGFRGAFPSEVLRAAVKGGMSEQQATADIRELMKDPIGSDTRDTGPMWTRLMKATAGSGIDLNEVFHDRADYGILRAPFVESTDGWLNLALKRVMHMAVEGGYDRVAFVTGEQSAERYDLSKQVDSILVKPKPAGVRRIGITMKGGGAISIDADAAGVVGNVSNNNADLAGKPLDEVVGKEMAEKIMATTEETTFTGLQLKVGGEGMRAFYNKIVPAATAKLLKKLGGGKMGQSKLAGTQRDTGPVMGMVVMNWMGIPSNEQSQYWRGLTEDQRDEAIEKWRNRNVGDGTVQPAFDITDAMREKVAGGLPMFQRQEKADQTQTPEFRRWFGNSKVVDAQGRPLVVYHGTNADEDFTAFKGPKIYFSPDPEYASGYADGGMIPGFPIKNSRVMPVYLSVQKPLDLRDMGDYRVERGDLIKRLEDAGVSAEGIASIKRNTDDYPMFLWTWMHENSVRLAIQEAGFDAVFQQESNGGKTGDAFIVFRPEQIKSATGNRGTFDPGNPDIRFSRSTLGGGQQPAPKKPNAWQQAKAKAAQLTSPDALDTLVYEYQDKLVDLKRMRSHISELGGTINDLNDAYQGEELYHARVAKRTKDFLEEELRPLLNDMRRRGVEMASLEQFLHARHAPEANKVLAERNPNQATINAMQVQSEQQVRALELQLQRAQSQGQATKAIQDALLQARAEATRWARAEAFKGTEDERTSLSGMSDAEAANIMASLTPEQRADMDDLAARVDAINAKTVRALEQYGLMGKDTLDAWRNTYKFYVPLHRDEAHPDSVSHPIGQGFSTKGDAAKRRTGSNEKVTNILGHIAMQREAALTRGEKNRVAKKLYLMAAQNPDRDFWQVDKAATQKIVDSETGLVRTVPDPMFKNRPNVVMVRINGVDRAVVFNERNPQAVRLAQSIKNADVGDLDAFTSLMGKGTRWFASVNTQYNPIFGMVNFTRDVQGAALQLSTTELRGQEKEVMADVPKALRGIYREIRQRRRTGTRGSDPWARLWEDMQDTGGTTGYRDLFTKPEERAQELLKELKRLDRGQTVKAAVAVVDWLSDFNETIENAVRLSVYKRGLDSGLSKERAASIAKNITVNFNRRGRKNTKLGAYYAFLNAAIQGTTRMVETLRGPAGKKIVLGGIMLGAINTLIGMAVMGGGGDDDEDNWEKIPKFVKERNIIVPLGREDYLTIPMPLGFNVLPNIGRKVVEMALHDDPTVGRMSHIGELARLVLDSFNPLGGSENLVQMVMPTNFDPAVALLQNQDWTGRPIYREDMSKLDPTPGFTRAKDSASTVSKAIAEAMNTITGGNDYQPGLVSWTPDQLDYVFGQLTGGLGRELMKVEQTLTAPITGEELPAYKIPLAGRLYGNTRGPANNSEKFYENVRQINMVENELQGRARAGDDPEGFASSEPLAQLVGAGNQAERRISELRKQRRDIIRQGLPGYQGEVREVNAQIGEVMKGLNLQVREAKREAQN